MIVTVLAHRRPAYLARTLAGLAACRGIGRCTLVAYTETLGCPAALAHLRAWTACPLWLLLGPDAPAGEAPYATVSRATYTVLDRAFRLGPFVAHFEEDVVPAPDALAYFAWAARTYRADPAVLTVSAFAHTPTALPVAEWHTVDRAAWFVPWGWGTWRDRWRALAGGWDFAFWDRGLNERLRGDRLLVAPRLSRVQHIGRRGGVTMTAAHWAHDQATPLWAGAIPDLPPGAFGEGPAAGAVS